MPLQEQLAIIIDPNFEREALEFDPGFKWLDQLSYFIFPLGNVQYITDPIYDLKQIQTTYQQLETARSEK